MPGSILNAAAGEILIYDVIVDDGSWGGGVTPKEVKAALDELKGKAVTLRINSPGGSVFAAVAMYSLLQAHGKPVHTRIDGGAFSAASYLALVGETIKIAAGGMVMIHDPWTIALGDAAEFRKTADMLDQISGQLVDAYAKRTGLEADEIAKMMSAETWMTAEEAQQKGFADEIIEHKSRPEDSARWDEPRFQRALARFRNSPRGWPVRPAAPRLDAGRNRLAAFASP